MKYLIKLLDRFGSAVCVSRRLLTLTEVFPTCSLSLPQRIGRITAVADIFDGAVYSANTSMESRAPQDLSWASD